MQNCDWEGVCYDAEELLSLYFGEYDEHTTDDFVASDWRGEVWG
jgi:hypothetical protein